MTTTPPTLDTSRAGIRINSGHKCYAVGVLHGTTTGFSYEEVAILVDAHVADLEVGGPGSPVWADELERTDHLSAIGSTIRVALARATQAERLELEEAGR